jgi:hypothetical protein
MTAIGDLVTARYVASYFGQPIVNSLSFSALDAYANFTELATALLEDLSAALGGINTDGVWNAGRSDTYLCQAAQVLDVSPGTAAMVAVTAAATGDSPDPGMPPNDAVCLTFRSDFKGQSGRGRIYLSGYPETMATSGFWEAGAQDAASAIGSAMIDNFGEGAAGARFRHCILHRVHLGVPVVPPEVKPVMSFTVHNEVRSLGRRAMGRRIHRTRTP